MITLHIRHINKPLVLQELPSISCLHQSSVATKFFNNYIYRGSTTNASGGETNIHVVDIYINTVLLKLCWLAHCLQRGKLVVSSFVTFK